MSTTTTGVSSPERLGVANQPPEEELKRGVLGLPAVVMQSVTHIAPALAVLFSLQFAVQEARVTAPLTYLAAFLLVLVLAVVLAQLAKHLPSAGGYFTYVSRTVSPRAGFMVGWLYFIYSPLCVGVVMAAIGSILQGELQAHYGINIPWWVWLILGVAVVGFLVIRGVELAARTMIIGGAIEMGIVLLLSLWGLFSPGHGGTNVSGFSPAHIPGSNGFFLAIVFTIFTFTGWEASAALGEESRNPRRNVPRGIIWSAIILGVFLVFTSWAQTIGWGTNNMGSLASSKELPSFVLASRFWHGAWFILLLALVNSALAGAIAYASVASRMWYAMARAGALPRPLTKIHPRFQTPVNAVVSLCCITLVVALVMGTVLGAFNQFVFYGIGLTFSLVFVYSAANLGVFLFYWKERRRDFNVLLHAILPIVGTLSVLWVGYKTINPFPTSPNNWAPIIVGAWFVAGLAVLVVMRMRGREAWLLEAGKIAFEDSETGRH